MQKENKSAQDYGTPFKRAQVRHKRQGDNPNRVDDIDEWLDFSRRPNEDDRIIQIPVPEALSEAQYYHGPIFGLRGFPGFMFAPQALASDVQNELAFQAVTEYCEAPHKTNIDQCRPKSNEEVDQSQSMWEHWKEENFQHESAKEKKRVSHDAGKRRYRSFKKLSWSTMGYHYDWTERSYNKKLKSYMPILVERLSSIFAKTSLLLEGKQSTAEVAFAPSASIVNFYSTKSNMGGHRDDLEFAVDKPIVSVSVGLPAVFLLGGKTKEESPVVPILVRSGDVICMGGDSRLNYHGMARLLPCLTGLPQMHPAFTPSEFEGICLRDVRAMPSTLSRNDSLALEHFLSSHRININVRQVYHDDSKHEELPIAET